MKAFKSSCDVLVVGAGPVGLALAIELGGRGHAVQIVEKADRIGRQPRAKTTNVRSMEHMRRWGVAEEVRKASPLAADYPNRIVFATGLFGHEITSFDNAFNADRTIDPRFPEPAQWIPQYEIERVLRDRALQNPSCSLAFGRALTGFTEEADGVGAVVQDAEGGSSTIRARYLVGADGAGSTVRKTLGIAMEGDGRIANFLSLVLRVPGLSERKRIPDALMYWLINPASPCVLGPMDRDDTWFWGTQLPPEGALDEASIRTRLGTSLGDDTPFEILVTDLWAAMRLQAKSYGTERVFLAGDACHLHPPFGGYGMNLGIADAVDLGWKLSAALEGWAGAGLLASYEAERRPVHKRVIDEAVENMGSLMQHFVNPHLAADDAGGTAARQAAAAAIQDAKDREFHSLGLVLGYDYAGSPLVVADGGAVPRESVTEYQPSASPGRRAPHAWLPDGQSLFDSFGRDFTLLDLGASRTDLDSVVAAATGAGLPLAIYAPTAPGLRDLYGATMILVRPDQHVAWRGDRVADASALIETVRGARGREGASLAA